MELKTLILLFYYERPKMVLNALQSVNELEGENWELAFIDDGSKASGEVVARKELSSRALAKTKFYNVSYKYESKESLKGSIFGKYTNEAIKNSDAELAIMLCDDDALMPNYIQDLSKYYLEHPEVNYAYSYVKYFDPSNQHYKEGNEIPTYWHPGSTYTLNMHLTPIAPVCAVDASQVSWRTSCNKIDNIWFPFPKTRGLDAALFEQLYAKYGLCHPLGKFGQYKGAFADQLGNRTGGDYNVIVK